MNSLLILQVVCCTVTFMLMGMYACSRLQLQWTNSRYELSRWLLCFSMFVLAFHYFIQIKHGLRASSDDVGALYNILFYAPVSFLVSFSIYNIECTKRGRKIFACVGVVHYVLILLIYIMGRMQYGGDHIGSWLYLMLVVFACTMLYFIIANLCAVRARRKNIELETAADLLPYDRYTWSSFLLLCFSALLITVAIFFRPLLFVIGPLMLISLFVFTMSFIGLGYNIRPLEAVLNEEETMVSEEEAFDFSEHKRQRIEKALQEWVDMGGFRDTSASMLTLAETVQFSRQELSAYFKQCLHSSFRLWLSDIRFEKAKALLIDLKHCSNEAISNECGFSSHTQLYRLFKTKTGMSPGQFKESLL